ncbi:MAG: GNAT family N-acetyltransferase [Planctomycetota bacterium]|nr:GNAT family N-acetyltransferase [Planctomycetota bacterium]
MSAERSRVYLEDRVSGQLVEAVLVDGIESNHLADFEQLWKSFPGVQQEEHGHWDWRKKVAYYSGQLSYNCFALECDGKTQGLMLVNTMKRCQLPQQTNKHLVYVEYLATAPWNRRSIRGIRGFKGVGMAMIESAIQLSIDESNHGRIGLHALPQADTFYREKCGMTDLGPDVSYSPQHPLRYFEMTESQAAALIRETDDETKPE